MQEIITNFLPCNHKKYLSKLSYQSSEVINSFKQAKEISFFSFRKTVINLFVWVSWKNKKSFWFWLTIKNMFNFNFFQVYYRLLAFSHKLFLQKAPTYTFYWVQNTSLSILILHIYYRIKHLHGDMEHYCKNR